MANVDNRESLLDTLAGGVEPELQSDLATRCNNFHTEVVRWELVRDTYLDTVVDDAIAQVEANVRPLPTSTEASSSSSNATSVPASPSTSHLFELPAGFPWRDNIKDSGDPAEGLPPVRKSKGQSDAWQAVYDTTMPLPSSYHPLVLAQGVMTKFVELEIDFRKAEALRTLEELRTNIIGVEAIKMSKRKVVGKTQTTRTQARIQTADAEVAKVANHYRRHWLALCALGMPDNDPHLRRLLDWDLQSFDFSPQQKPGKSMQQTSWLWGNLSFVDTKQEGQHAGMSHATEQDQRYREFYEDGMC